MRSWFHVFTALFVFATLEACSDDTSSGTTPDNPSGTNDGSDGEETDGGNTNNDQTPPTSKVNTTTETIDVDGTARKYVLSVPKTYDGKRSYPLILALHGDGQDAAGFASESKLDVSTGDDAILAFPDQSVDLFTPYEQNVDQKMLERIIATVKGKYSIDASKVWGFGYSKGGFQLNMLACRKPGLITAMADHAGGAPRDENGNLDCPNAVGLPVFVTQGGLDKDIGGDDAANYWAGRAGCQSTMSKSTPDICQAYDGCPPDKPVVYCVVPNQPHYPLYGNAAAHSWAWFNKL